MQKRNWESMNFVQIGMFCLQRQLFVHSSADRNSTKKTDSKFKLQSHHTIFGCEIRSLRCWRQCGGIRCHIWQRIVVAIYLSPKRWSHFKHHFFWRIFHQTTIPSKTNLSGQPRRLCDHPGVTPLALLESTGATLKAEPLTFPAASDGAVLWLLLNGKRAMGRWKQNALHHILGFLVQIVQLEVDINKSSESKANPIHWKETNMCFIYG